MGAWIEIMYCFSLSSHISVAPLVGAWIEITDSCKMPTAPLVAPLVGAWIEICKHWLSGLIKCVAPLVGAWIEMLGVIFIHFFNMSLPLWERGLKYTNISCFCFKKCRSPCGSVAWIEIYIS